MAHSRLEKIGTIYTRITGLIRSGAMKLEDRPLWYEVYQAFPPKYPPRYDRPFPEDPVKQILYPEDAIRAKFYKAVRNANIPNLSDSEHQTLSQKCISMCNKLQKEQGCTLDEAFESVLKSLKEESDSKRSKQETEVEVSNLEEKPSVKIKELFN